MGVHPAILAEAVQAVRCAGDRRKRAAAIRHYADLAGVSPAQLRRHLRQAGVDFGYKRRADAGSVRDAARAAAADAVANLIVASRGDMPTWLAIDTARKAGLVAADLDLPAHYVDRYLRAQGIERRPRSGPAAPRTVKWHVGEELQIDSTNCQQWFFVEPDGRIRYTEDGEVYHNKPAKHAPIIRYVATDPASGLFRVWYYLTEGESAQVLLDFLYRVMTRAEHPDVMPLAGVPKALIVDRGPGNMSAAVENLCNELGIDLRSHRPKRSWAKGSVEEAMHLWQRSFESKLRLWPATSLEELNARAYRANLEFCATRPHSVHGAPRAAYYARLMEGRQIVLPPPWEAFVEAARTTRVERTVRGSFISFEGAEYYVGALQGVRVGDKVLVAKAVLDWDAESRPVRLWFGEQCVVERAQVRDASGTYRDERVYRERQDAVLAQREEERQLRVAAAREIAAQEPPVDVERLPRVAAPAVRFRVEPEPAVVPTVRRDVALLDLRQRVGRRLTRFEVQGLRWGETVTQAQIEHAAAALTQAASEGGRAASAG